ncbi:hypothetical protein AN958_00038 [Leucoagaricus sp. SymC.cos]|nr:hypothetical protein AN958_00038 [Leucoagaricus sp. SymC.cos]
MSVFDPLVQILGEAENQAMMRSQLGGHLAKRKGLYQSAGVNGFGEYIALAVKRQIIVWTGTEQVKLKKRR